MILFWVVTACRLVGRYRRFGETCYLRLSSEDVAPTSQIRWFAMLFFFTVCTELKITRLG
jgi:hypothetical protein